MSINIGTEPNIETGAKQYHHGDLKASLIAAANILLVREGADALSLRAIAAEVGVSHMAPYAHFKNKKALIKSVAKAGFVQLSYSMEKVAQQLEAADHDSIGERVLAYGVRYLEFATQNPQLYRLMLGQIETTGRKRSAPLAAEQDRDFEQQSKRPFVLLREAFGLRGGDEQLIRAQALGAWSMVHGMAALMLEGHVVVPEGTTLKQFLAAATPKS